MQLFSLMMRLFVGMALAVIFLGRDPGEAVTREARAVDTRVVKAAAVETPKPIPGSFEVASIGSLDGILAPAAPDEAEAPAPEPEPAPLFVTGTRVVFERPEIRTDYSLADAPADMRPDGIEMPEGARRDLAYVSGSRVNLRQGPSTGTRVVATLTEGTSVELIGTSGDWINILDLQTGKEGYMSARFLTETRP